MVRLDIEVSLKKVRSLTIITDKYRRGDLAGLTLGHDHLERIEQPSVVAVFGGVELVRKQVDLLVYAARVDKRAQRVEVRQYDDGVYHLGQRPAVLAFGQFLKKETQHLILKKFIVSIRCYVSTSVHKVNEGI